MVRWWYLFQTPIFSCVGEALCFNTESDRLSLLAGIFRRLESSSRIEREHYE